MQRPQASCCEVLLGQLVSIIGSLAFKRLQTQGMPVPLRLAYRMWDIGRARALIAAMSVVLDLSSCWRKASLNCSSINRFLFASILLGIKDSAQKDKAEVNTSIRTRYMVAFAGMTTRE